MDDVVTEKTVFVVFITGNVAAGVGQSSLPGHILSGADSGGVRGQLGNSAQRFSQGKFVFFCLARARSFLLADCESVCRRRSSGR